MRASRVLQDPQDLPVLRGLMVTQDPKAIKVNRANKAQLAREVRRVRRVRRDLPGAAVEAVLQELKAQPVIKDLRAQPVIKDCPERRALEAIKDRLVIPGLGALLDRQDRQDLKAQLDRPERRALEAIKDRLVTKVHRVLPDQVAPEADRALKI